MNSLTPAERALALADLEKYYNQSWNAAHAFYADSSSLPIEDNSPEATNIAQAIRERLTEKGKTARAEIRAYIFDKPLPSGSGKELDKALSSISPDRYPILEIAMRLSDGAWFCIFQSMQFESGDLIWLHLLQLAGIAFIFCIILFMLLKFIAQPLRGLARTAESFGANPEQYEILPEKGAREVQIAIKSFNIMSKRLRNNLDERDQMLVAMAHDLKTPLCKLQLRLEELEDGELRQKLMDNCADLLSTINNCLELARSLKTGEAFVEVDMGAFAQSIADDYAWLGKNVVFRSEGPQTMLIRTRPVCLKRCVLNLVDNALAYAGNAEIILAERDGCPFLSIEDNGPGAPEDELEKILQPWHRLEYSRNRATGGTGLGLAIAKNLACLCKASIILENRKKGGLRAGLIFKFN